MLTNAVGIEQYMTKPLNLNNHTTKGNRQSQLRPQKDYGTVFKNDFKTVPQPF